MVDEPLAASPDTNDDPGERLLKAALGLAAVMRYGSLTLAQTADRVEQYDHQPYPLTYVVMSNHVSSFLRALAQLEHSPRGALGGFLRPRPRYGPPLREP